MSWCPAFSQAKRARLRELERRIEDTQTEVTHLTEAIRAEQQKAVEGIRAEERKAACLKQRAQILRALGRACQGTRRTSGAQKQEAGEGDEELDRVRTAGRGPRYSGLPVTTRKDR